MPEREEREEEEDFEEIRQSFFLRFRMELLFALIAIGVLFVTVWFLPQIIHPKAGPARNIYRTPGQKDPETRFRSNKVYINTKRPATRYP